MKVVTLECGHKINVDDEEEGLYLREEYPDKIFYSNVFCQPCHSEYTAYKKVVSVE